MPSGGGTATGLPMSFRPSSFSAADLKGVGLRVEGVGLRVYGLGLIRA